MTDRPPFLKLRPRGERALLPGIDPTQPVLHLPQEIFDALVEDLKATQRYPDEDKRTEHEVMICGVIDILKIRPGPLEFDYE